MRPFDVHYPSNSPIDDRTTKDLKASKKRGKNLSMVSSNEQGCVTKWCEEVRVNRMERVETDHSDSILCIHFLGDKYVATGSKDTTLNIYSLDGRKLRTLRGHEAAICCLATVKSQSGDILASGSDNGCGSVILWDPRSWQIMSKIQAHEAAVTSIVDLDDGRHIATGSYDKKINIFSMSRNQKLLTLSNRASVTGMVMNADKTRLVTAGLDKSVSVWNILRRNGVFIDLCRLSKTSSVRKSSAQKNWSASFNPLS
jgi:WD40 repeat protein